MYFANLIFRSSQSKEDLTGLINKSQHNRAFFSLSLSLSVYFYFIGLDTANVYIARHFILFVYQAPYLLQKWRLLSAYAGIPKRSKKHGQPCQILFFGWPSQRAQLADLEKAGSEYQSSILLVMAISRAKYKGRCKYPADSSVLGKWTIDNFF